jgi:2,4-diketo-3-deoxy-L-fuconate hydrolase
VRFGNLNGRLVLVREDGVVDVEEASDGRFGSDPQGAFDDWEGFRSWAVSDDSPANAYDESQLGAPVPGPRQIFAIGLNYRDHAAEGGAGVPDSLVVFTKFASSIAGPFDDVPIPSDTIDWEVELVVVVGVGGRAIARDDAWAHVAGVTVGQDISDREMQLRGEYPQFSLSKSLEAFSPIGPWVVTPDELDHPDDITIRCDLDGVPMQSETTARMIFSVPLIIERLSHAVELYPGDLIFTGTPSGVGMGRRPQRYLRPGEILTSEIDGVGRLRNRMIAPRA